MASRKKITYQDESAELNDLESRFIEQAEYLEDTEFSSWATQHPHESQIFRKLRGSGAKLIIGPRGSGKTTLFLKALHQMLSEADSDVLPIYVNFKNSLRLEPIYKSNANASFWFKQWLFLKSLSGLSDTLSKLEISIGEAEQRLFKSINSVIDSLQTINLEAAKEGLLEPLNNSSFSESLRAALKKTKRGRVVFLFDDAGHAFSPEQQKDFFDFFRSIKSPEISPKAAIYPGITDFSATFHSGHDAEEVNVWMDPRDDKYIHFMTTLLKKRLPKNIYSQFESSSDVLNILALAAFGIPRNLLNMVRMLSTGEDDSHSSTKKINKAQTNKAISICAQTSLQVFQSLKDKLPMYGEFIEKGAHLLDNTKRAIKAYNAKTTGAKSVTIAINSPVPPEFKTLISFFQYAGLMRPRGSASRGTTGTYDLFDVHYSLLIDANAILAHHSPSLSDTVRALTSRSAQALTRTTANKLLGTNEIAAALPLLLPPCQVCNTPRATQTAKFCLNCGAQLTLKSTFETAVNQDIAVLPLTKNRVNSIKEQSSVNTIKDILLDKDHKELLKVRMVGPVWASRIARYAEEFVE